MSFAILLISASTLRAVATDVPPDVDGKLEDSCWAGALPADSFTQKFPSEGTPPSERTTVRVLYDRSAIYFGISCEQRSSPVVGRLTRRDREVESDRVAIDIDTRADGKSAFHFEVNAAGVISDAIRFDQRFEDGTDLLLDWDENWRAATQTSSAGWTAEIEIPLRVLRFDESSTPSWGLEVRRYVSSTQEVDELAFVPRSTAGEMQHYGRLEFPEPLEPGGSLEIRPFVLGQVQRRDRSEELLASGGAPSASAGVDARWHVSQDMTLDLALNPDFGQIEADQVLLNLTNFELFFPEKRPLFLEGQETFQTPLLVLYTRRIGRQPDSPELAAGDRQIDAPEPATILGAAKLVGRVSPDVTVATLSAVTAPQYVGVKLADRRTEGERLIDPATYFQAARVLVHLGEHASAGAIATAVKRFETQEAGHDAYTGGLDFRWRSDSGDYVAKGQAVASLIQGGPDRTSPDGTVISSGDVAPGGMVQVSKEGGTWLFDLLYQGFAPKLDLNDAGFLERQNLHRFFGAFAYRDTEPWGPLLGHKAQIEVFKRVNSEGLSLAEGYQINESGQLTNFLKYFVEFHYRPAYFDDREVGDGTALERARLFGLEIGVSTDRRAPVVAEFFTQSQLMAGGGMNLALEGNVSLKLLPELDLEIGPQAVYAAGELRYAGDSEQGSHLFGELEAAAIGATVRATYTFTPTLSLQAYGQLFFAYEHYSEFRRYTGQARIVTLDDPALDTIGAAPIHPDVQDGTFNANLVLRWEYLPGSTLFFVYTRSQSGSPDLAGDARPQLDFRSISAGPAIDVLAVKLSYWWGS